MANPIDSDDNLAKALGRLAGRWGLAEIMVEWIFNLVSEMPFRKSAITFSFFKAVGTQKDLTLLLIDETEWISEKDKETVKTTLKKFTTMATKRNYFIHYPFGYADSDEGKTMYKMKRHRTGEALHTAELVKVTDIELFADQILELQQDLQTANQILRDAWLQKS